MAIELRRLAAGDAPAATSLFRLAFGTHLGLADPDAFMGDADLVGPRLRSGHCSCWGAYEEDDLVATVATSRWGRFAVLGPLTVRPSHWNRGLGQRLTEASMADVAEWGCSRAGLFTFSDSPKHIGLYQKFGFRPQYLTVVMSRGVADSAGDHSASTLSEAAEDSDAVLGECDSLTDRIAGGLSLRGEIQLLREQRLGDTVLTRRGTRLEGFAVCHVGAGSEAGSGTTYVKFAAAAKGVGAAERFSELIDACDNFARASGSQQIVTGVNTAREDAYALMLGKGFETQLIGVAMQRPNEPGHNASECFVLDDWR
jgi:GNAT superfamily N-acetyltransferase